MGKIIKGERGDWEIVVGIEIHAQITAQSKLFSGASADFGAAPNNQVSLVDAAMPGMLPVLNKKCVEQAIRTGLGLNAKINTTSIFARKNYFYPDLPQGYQISQYDLPLAVDGYLEIEEDGRQNHVGIDRVHLEEDVAKLHHFPDAPGESYSLVDVNRSGVPLMEDVMIARALGKKRLVLLSADARTSAEKYERDGWRKRAWSNAFLLTRFLLGTKPEILAKAYR